MHKIHQPFSVLFCNIVFITVSFKASLCQEINEENICLKNPNNVIIGNPYDCFSFYACQHGNAMKIICPNNSIFNPKLGNCDPNYSTCIIEEDVNTTIIFPDKKDILSEDMSYEEDEVDETNTSNLSTIEETTKEQYNSTQSPSTTDTTSLTDIMPTTESSNNCDTSPKPIPPNNNYVQCPSNDTDNPSFLPSDSFCDSFFLCYHGRPFEMFCPIGFYWNQEQKECILERQSNCTDASMWNKVPQCPSIGQHFFPHIERCNCFYYCEHGIRSIQQCAAFKQWDIVEQTCKLDITARCIKNIPRSQRAKYYTL